MLKRTRNVGFAKGLVNPSPFLLYPRTGARHSGGAIATNEVRCCGNRPRNDNLDLSSSSSSKGAFTSYWPLTPLTRGNNVASRWASFFFFSSFHFSPGARRQAWLRRRRILGPTFCFRALAARGLSSGFLFLPPSSFSPPLRDLGVRVPP